MAYIRTHETTERETPVFVAHVRGELVAQSFGAVSAFHSRTVFVATTPDQPVPVGAERHTRHLLAMPFEPSSRRKVLVKDLDSTVKGPLALASGWLSRRTLDPCPSSTPSLRA
jgi:hypothetical protein